MQPIATSFLLQSLGYTLINSLWQVAIIWLLYILFTNFLKLPSKHKYLIAVVAQIIGFCSFIYTFFYNFFSTSSNLKNGLFLQSNNFNSFFIPLILKVEKALPYLSVVYLLVTIILFIKIIVGFNHTNNLRINKLHKANAEWRVFVNEMAIALGLNKEVKIYLSELVNTPLTIGYFKPIILLPLASINNLSTYQIEAVILHELAHIKRFDFLVNILLLIVEIVLFFNPFSRLLSEHIKQERENSCDDWVLQFKYCPNLYANALLQIAMSNLRPYQFGMAAISNKNELLKRINRITNSKSARKNYSVLRIGLAFMLFALLSFTFFFSGNIQNESINKATNRLLSNTIKNEVKTLSHTGLAQNKSSNNQEEQYILFEKLVKEPADIESISTNDNKRKLSTNSGVGKPFNSKKNSAKNSKPKINDTELEEEDFEIPESSMPFSYAFNTLNDSSYTVTATDIEQENNISKLIIRKKGLTEKELEKIIPKRYDIVISNEGKPDKKIILEVWQ